jgi:hypothetical protein
MNRDKIKDIIAATKTLKVVAFFQNKATKKITKIPGVKNPVKF